MKQGRGNAIYGGAVVYRMGGKVPLSQDFKEGGEP